jgi:N-methylhydantoinase A/oxoprolinase/acetone carboxylase beta subunit
MRYQGQMHTVRVDLTGLRDAASLHKRFQEIYVKRYGHAHPGSIEFVALRSIARSATPKPVLHRATSASHEPPRRSRHVWSEAAGGWIDTPAHFLRDLHTGFRCHGPVLIEDYGSTCVVDSYDKVEIGSFGEIRIEISPRSVA